MNSILEIPEVLALDGPSGLIRIPNQIDVPVTQRVLRLVDTPEFQRLMHISQLGVVSFVYPAANHNRFEHSLGVYRMALLFLRHFSHHASFVENVSPHDAQRLILAALLHDIGHWPFCHPMEDLGLEGVPRHEEFGRSFIASDNVTACLKEDWQIEPDEIIDLVSGIHRTNGERILGSILSGPIDIDKMDYLYRDSLHAGVPYGQNFDAARLIRSLCLNRSNDRLAITHKGKTAAELMVFARYVMFSEVYWHHAVRSATAMLQRAFYLWHQQHHQAPGFAETIAQLFRMRENELLQTLTSTDKIGDASRLLNSIFGERRVLFKRIANYSSFEAEDTYREIAQRPYAWVVACSQHLSDLIGQQMGRKLNPNQVLIDAPPVGLEVQFNLDVLFEREQQYRDLGSVSPVVQTLAHRQFDDFVKQVRVFVAPEILGDVKGLEVHKLLDSAIELTHASPGELA